MIIAYNNFSDKETVNLLWPNVVWFEDLEEFLRAEADAVIVCKDLNLINQAYYFYFHFTKRNIDVKFHGHGKLDLNALDVLKDVAIRENLRSSTLRAKGQKEKRDAGGYLGGPPPYGYEAKDRKLVINPKEAMVVKYIYDIRKNHSLKDIADILNGQGIKTKRGKTFTTATIQAILKNEMIYKGFMNRGGRTKGVHDAII